jgi:hypothetical protein
VTTPGLPLVTFPFCCVVGSGSVCKDSVFGNTATHCLHVGANVYKLVE